MDVASTRNIPKGNVYSLEDAPVPEKGVLFQVRAGKEQHGPTFVTATGIAGDEYAAKSHGGTERAVYQYNPAHYPDWQAENAPKPNLYDVGAFGENIITTNISNNNVYIGDLYKLGDKVLLEGDTISLVKRPYPKWLVLNMQRILRLPMPNMWIDIRKVKLRSSPKPYILLTFKLKEDLTLNNLSFNPYSLGVSLDRNSRGGSAYIHNGIKVGDEIKMSPGNNLGAQENDTKADPNLEHILIVRGIGITAFLPLICEWEAKGVPYHLHYAKLNIQQVIPQPKTEDKTFPARIFSCGPGGMMKECQRITTDLGYPEHMVHFEDFGSGEPETNRHETMTVPSNKTLLDVLNEAGFDILYLCKSGAYSACLCRSGTWEARDRD
ncbi:pyruvate kinase-like protein [Fusarium redolens]|uniref:Pyruvate kinase-like protein n=1 Tax=Fusarium redolens TaxID=48865 RepID=A0A9P9FYP1_FUSRE|nr:pyruvate kinase-like protein [Fusarium redolens]KAH7220428.1 pyruvate kinase-like protein [Fusarium redolens]